MEWLCNKHGKKRIKVVKITGMYGIKISDKNGEPVAITTTKAYCPECGEPEPEDEIVST